MNRAVIGCMALALATAVGGAACDTGSQPRQATQTTPTQPSPESVRSLLMNDWRGSLAMHYSRQLYRADSQLFGPYLAGLHDAADWPTNQIDGATALFRAESVDGDPTGAGGPGGVQPTGPERAPELCESSGEVTGDDGPVDPEAPHSYPSVMCFDEGGVMNVEYLRETELGLPIQIEKSYAMPPEQGFLVLRYRLTNNLPTEDDTRVRVRVSEVVDLNNKAAPDHEESGDDLAGTGINEPQGDRPIAAIRGRWDPELDAWIADMSRSNGTFLVFGAFQEMDGHRAFRTAGDDVEFGRAIAPEAQAIDAPDPAPDVDTLTASDLGLSSSAEVVLDAGETQELSFFYAVAPDLHGAQRIARQAREPETSESWFDRTRSEYEDWLEEGRPVEARDPGLRAAYSTALVTDKQSQHPEFGNFVAATNPAYGFKVWARDSSVTAMGLAASGHPDEATRYYRWMASVQEDGSRAEFPPGTWDTTYSYWHHKLPVRFVVPEHDAIGLFLIGVYHTWRLLDEDPEAAEDFLTGRLEQFDQGPTSVYQAVTRAAGFIVDNVDEHDFGPADHSIWEEALERATFTQVTYASGLNAARLLAEAMGEADHAREWLDGARRIGEAISRPATTRPCPGLWNDAEARWNRGTWPDCTIDDRLDASTDLVWVFGLLDADDERTRSQREEVLERLTPGEDDLGIARYEGDTFYSTSPYSPGGQGEASADLASWPQMDMYMSMLEHWAGMDDIALDRLRWYVRVTNAGHMPPGEGVDWQTDRPLPSTAAEPVTGTWYVLGFLNYLDVFDPRLPPLDEEVGAG